MRSTRHTCAQFLRGLSALCITAVWALAAEPLPVLLDKLPTDELLRQSDALRQQRIDMEATKRGLEDQRAAEKRARVDRHAAELAAARAEQDQIKQEVSAAQAQIEFHTKHCEIARGLPATPQQRREHDAILTHASRLVAAGPGRLQAPALKEQALINGPGAGESPKEIALDGQIASKELQVADLGRKINRISLILEQRRSEASLKKFGTIPPQPFAPNQSGPAIANDKKPLPKDSSTSDSTVPPPSKNAGQNDSRPQSSQPDVKVDPIARPFVGTFKGNGYGLSLEPSADGSYLRGTVTTRQGTHKVVAVIENGALFLKVKKHAGGIHTIPLHIVNGGLRIGDDTDPIDLRPQ